MNIYLISNDDNIAIARKMFGRFRDINYILPESKDDVTMEYFRYKVRMNFRNSDVVVVMLDSDFSEDAALKSQLGFVLRFAQKEQKLILPIVVDGSKLPENLNGYMYIKYDSEMNERQIYSTLKNVLYRNKIIDKEKNSNMLYITFASVALSIVVICLTLIIPYTESLMFFNNEALLEFITGVVVAISCTTLTTSYLFTVKRKRVEDEKKEIASYSDRLKQIIPDEDVSNTSNKNEIDALGRMLLNLEDINIYYKWSQKQAQASFWLAVVMCILGFVLISFAVISVILFKNNMAVSTISIVGGAIVEIFAGTALIVYKKSLTQANHYHKALHEDERFLSSVNLLNSFTSEEAKEEMLKEIIRNEMKLNIIGASLNLQDKTIDTTTT